MVHNRCIHMFGSLFIFLIAAIGTEGYIPSNPGKDPFISDILLHEIVDRMGKDLADVADSYIEPISSPIKEMPSRLSLMARATKDLEAEQLDYDSILSGNQNPSLRDQEYMRHSSLWGHHYITGGSSEIGPQYLANSNGDNIPHHFKLQPKTDATLPAYCNPPNPCPVGYTEDQGCQINFENTAAFSRDYQSAQECMCDGEHMFDCPGPKDTLNSGRQINSDLQSFFERQFSNGEQKRYVDKFQPYQNLNPFLDGEKLPIAAKKGNNAY